MTLCRSFFEGDGGMSVGRDANRGAKLIQTLLKVCVCFGMSRRVRDNAHTEYYEFTNDKEDL